MNLRAVLGDITVLEVDVIVNAANSSLRGGGGVDGAIHRAAGPELVLESMRLAPCRTGEAKITGGHRLPAKHIVHTVGPVWQGGSKGEADLLASCYQHSLKLAADVEARTIAFPCISTGIFGYPSDRAAETAVAAVRDSPHQIEEVVFCCFLPQDFALYEQLLPLKEVISYSARCDKKGKVMDCLASNHPSRREVLAGLGGLAAMGSTRAKWSFMNNPQQIPTPSAHVAAFELMAFGMFVHWGLYSQMGQGEWIQNAKRIPGEEYFKLMESFTAEDFDAAVLAKTAKRAGMKYITLTSRHHEGFSLYDTRGLSRLDVMNTPAKRDLIAEFTAACRAEGLVPMVYHTTLDWNDARFTSDWDGYLNYLRDSVELLCTEYGAMGGFWFDGNWSKPDADWKEDELYAVIRKHQPEAMIINNTGVDALGHVGNPEIDSVTFERGRPKPIDRSKAKKYIAGEMCHTMNFHWGFARKDFNFLSPAHVIEELCFARRAGANLLMNIGPEPQGKVPEYEAAALAKVGDWINLHGGAEGVMYRGRPVNVSGDGDDFALEFMGELYLFVTELTQVSNTQVHGRTERGPGPRTFRGIEGAYRKAVWVDNGEELKLSQDGETLTMEATGYPYGTNTVIRIARLSR